MKQGKTKKAGKGNSIRVGHENKKWIDDILKAANKKEHGRRIKIDDLLLICRGKVSDADIEMMRAQSLSNEDRKEKLRQSYIQEVGPISKDAFTGFMMTDAFQEFLAAHKTAQVVAPTISIERAS